MKNVLMILTICSALVVSTFAFADGHQKGAGDFKECAALRMQEIALKHLLKDDPKYFTQVPKGWTVVSGTGGEGHPKLLVCR